MESDIISDDMKENLKLTTGLTIPGLTNLVGGLKKGITDIHNARKNISGKLEVVTSGMDDLKKLSFILSQLATETEILNNTLNVTMENLDKIDELTEQLEVMNNNMCDLKEVIEKFSNIMG